MGNAAQLSLLDLPKPLPAEEVKSMQWRCYRAPDGSPRVALALLYAVVFRAGAPVAIECPVLERRWDAVTDYLRDSVVPFYAASSAYAAELLHLPVATAESLAFFTLAKAGETSPLLNDIDPLDSYWPADPIKGASL